MKTDGTSACFSPAQLQKLKTAPLGRQHLPQGNWSSRCLGSGAGARAVSQGCHSGQCPRDVTPPSSTHPPWGATVSPALSGFTSPISTNCQLGTHRTPSTWGLGTLRCHRHPSIPVVASLVLGMGTGWDTCTTQPLTLHPPQTPQTQTKGAPNYPQQARGEDFWLCFRSSQQQSQTSLPVKENLLPSLAVSQGIDKRYWGMQENAKRRTHLPGHRN